MNKKNLENKTNLEEKMKTKASSGKMLLFYQFECPHCKTMNVCSKDYKMEISLCSNTGCRKIIIIENFKDIA